MKGDTGVVCIVALLVLAAVLFKGEPDIVDAIKFRIAGDLTCAPAQVERK